uniref:Uncharacterized protein n=1 Tax=Meloidogyne enterolobii TaxID=390850 RepID=A0A6V7WJS3_MELEN|nr:unnamed protein product [Meloidogyne enterolobii]
MEEGKFYYSKIFLFNIVFLDFRVYINIGKTWEHITQFKFVKIPKIVNKFKNYSIMHSTTICALIFLAVFGIFLNQCGGQQQPPPKPATVTAVKPGAPPQKTGANKDSSESEEDDKQHPKTNATGAAPQPLPAFCQQNAADPAVQKCCTALKAAAATHKPQGNVKLPECVQCGQKCNIPAPVPAQGAPAHPQVAGTPPKPH